MILIIIELLRIIDHEIFENSFLGPASAAKGFYLLKDCLDSYGKNVKNFVLDIHFQPTEKSEYMKIHDRYNYNELKKFLI